MGYIKEEPLVKKLFLCVLGLMIITYGLFTWFQFSQLNTIHKKQIEAFQRVVGVIVSEYPEKEIEIIEAIFKGDSDKKQHLGSEILRKYGYNLEMEMANDITFSTFREEFIEINLWIMALILIANIILLIFIFKKVGMYFEYVSDTLENFLKGKYKSKEYDLNGGVMSRVSNQLKQVADAIGLKQQRLIQERESSQELVTDISHQLKTPLASLDMCNSILLDEDLTKEERLEFLNSSEISIKKLGTLVDVLVNISRLEADMIKITKTEKSIKETLTKAINGVYMKALNKNIEVELQEFPDVMIPHDSKWTEEAIFNVLENGIKYTPKGGQINVQVSTNFNYVRIIIKDSGIGIEKEFFNDIFKRFHRGSNDLVKEQEGSGVGLYLARKIIEEQGGSIMVKSKIGEGSEFSIILSRN